MVLAFAGLSTTTRSMRWGAFQRRGNVVGRSPAVNRARSGDGSERRQTSGQEGRPSGEAELEQGRRHGPDRRVRRPRQLVARRGGGREQGGHPPDQGGV